MRKIPFIILTILISCTNVKHNQDYNLIELSPFEKPVSPILIDSMVKEFKILKLDTPEGILIGKINRIKFSQERIFICDFKIMNAVFIFDHSGQYINHIQGGFKGPGEFIRPQSITADNMTNELYVFDDKLQKIIHYDMDGKYIDEMKFKYTSCDIAKINEDLFSFNSGYPQIDNNVNGNDLIFASSSSGKVTDKFLPLKNWRIQSYFNKENTFLEYKDTVWYSPVYNDTIYLLNEYGPIPVFKFNMGDKFVNDRLAKFINVEDEKMEYTPAISNFVKVGDIVYIDFRVISKEGYRVSHITFFDLNSRNVISGEFYVPTGYTYGLFKPPLTTDGDYFVNYVDAFDAKESMERKLNQGIEFPEEIMDLYLNLSEDDNPLLLFYKVAPF